MPTEPERVELPEELAEPAARELRRRILGRGRGEVVLLDARRLRPDDSPTVARLLRAVADARAAGVDVRLTEVPDWAFDLLRTIDATLLDSPRDTSASEPVLVRVGARALDSLDGAARAGRLLEQTAVNVALPFGRRGVDWGRTVQQMSLVGASAVPIVTFISLLVGLVLGLNGARQLQQFGAAIFVANLVAISMTREMGPLLAAIIVAARSGSSIAAELGSMKVSEEIDAMETMALSPVRYLVVPKIVALVLTLPLLTVVADTAGIAGGYAVGVLGLELGANAYLSKTVQSLFVSDVLTGLVKSVIFAVLIGAVSCHRGLSVRGGPEAVGRATTSAVVTSIVFCIVANAFFTAFFYFTG